MENYIIDIKLEKKEFEKLQKEFEKKLVKKLENICDYLYFFLCQYTNEISIELLKR